MPLLRTHASRSLVLLLLVSWITHAHAFTIVSNVTQLISVADALYTSRLLNARCTVDDVGVPTVARITPANGESFTLTFDCGAYTEYYVGTHVGSAPVEAQLEVITACIAPGDRRGVTIDDPTGELALIGFAPSTVTGAAALDEEAFHQDPWGASHPSLMSLDSGGSASSPRMPGRLRDGRLMGQGTRHSRRHAKRLREAGVRRKRRAITAGALWAQARDASSEVVSSARRLLAIDPITPPAVPPVLTTLPSDVDDNELRSYLTRLTDAFREYTILQNAYFNQTGRLQAQVVTTLDELTDLQEELLKIQSDIEAARVRTEQVQNVTLRHITNFNELTSQNVLGMQARLVELGSIVNDTLVSFSVAERAVFAAMNQGTIDITTQQVAINNDIKEHALRFNDALGTQARYAAYAVGLLADVTMTDPLTDALRVKVLGRLAELGSSNTLVPDATDNLTPFLTSPGVQPNLDDYRYKDWDASAPSDLAVAAIKIGRDVVRFVRANGKMQLVQFDFLCDVRYVYQGSPIRSDIALSFSMLSGDECDPNDITTGCACWYDVTAQSCDMAPVDGSDTQLDQAATRFYNGTGGTIGANNQTNNVASLWAPYCDGAVTTTHTRLVDTPSVVAYIATIGAYGLRSREPSKYQVFNTMLSPIGVRETRYAPNGTFSFETMYAPNGLPTFAYDLFDDMATSAVSARVQRQNLAKAVTGVMPGGLTFRDRVLGTTSQGDPARCRDAAFVRVGDWRDVYVWRRTNSGSASLRVTKTFANGTSFVYSNSDDIALQLSGATPPDTFTTIGDPSSRPLGGKAFASPFVLTQASPLPTTNGGHVTHIAVPRNGLQSAVGWYNAYGETIDAFKVTPASLFEVDVVTDNNGNGACSQSPASPLANSAFAVSLHDNICSIMDGYNITVEGHTGDAERVMKLRPISQGFYDALVEVPEGPAAFIFQSACPIPSVTRLGVDYTQLTLTNTANVPITVAVVLSGCQSESFDVPIVAFGADTFRRGRCATERSRLYASIYRIGYTAEGRRSLTACSVDIDMTVASRNDTVYGQGIATTDYVRLTSVEVIDANARDLRALALRMASFVADIVTTNVDVTIQRGVVWNDTSADIARLMERLADLQRRNVATAASFETVLAEGTEAFERYRQEAEAAAASDADRIQINIDAALARLEVLKRSVNSTKDLLAGLQNLGPEVTAAHTSAITAQEDVLNRTVGMVEAQNEQIANINGLASNELKAIAASAGAGAVAAAWDYNIGRDCDTAGELEKDPVKIAASKKFCELVNRIESPKDKLLSDPQFIAVISLMSVIAALFAWLLLRSYMLIPDEKGVRPWDSFKARVKLILSGNAPLPGPSIKAPSA